MLTVRYFDYCEHEEEHKVPVSMSVFAPFPGVNMGKIYNPEAATKRVMDFAKKFMATHQQDDCGVSLDLGGSLIDTEIGENTEFENILWCVNNLIKSHKELNSCPTLGKKDKNNGEK